MPKPALLALVLPCYNEQDTLPQMTAALLDLCDRLATQGLILPASYLLLVDDGSTDDSWATMQALHARLPQQVKALRLSRNFGQQSALLAGMQHARADVVVTLDADGQDDPEAIVHMLQLYYEGYEVVYGVRASRRTDTRVKRVPAKSYYRLLRMLGIRIIYNHAEYRLVSARVLRALDEYTEVNLFLRGIFPEMGFRAGLVYYPRMKRIQGSSKYNLARLWRLAMDGITSFSTAPLRVVTVAGLLTFVLTFVLSGYALYSYLRLDTVPGWASTVLPIYFIGGVQLISIGIMGEYLAKIYMETKRRPRYLVEEQLD